MHIYIAVQASELSFPQQYGLLGLWNNHFPFYGNRCSPLLSSLTLTSPGALSEQSQSVCPRVPSLFRPSGSTGENSLPFKDWIFHTVCVHGLFSLLTRGGQGLPLTSSRCDPAVTQVCRCSCECPLPVPFCSCRVPCISVHLFPAATASWVIPACTAQGFQFFFFCDNFVNAYLLFSVWKILKK